MTPDYKSILKTAVLISKVEYMPPSGIDFDVFEEEMGGQYTIGIKKENTPVIYKSCNASEKRRAQAELFHELMFLGLNTVLK